MAWSRPKRRPPARPRWMGIVSSVLGALLIVKGVTTLVMPQSGPLAIAIGALIAGAVLLTPVASALRGIIPALKPAWAPPVLAVALLLLCLPLSGVLNTPGEASVASAAAPAAPATTGSTASEAKDPVLERIAQQAVARRRVLEAMSPAERFALEVTDHDLAAVEQLPMHVPASNGEIFQRVGQIDDLARKLNAGLELPLDPDQKKVAEQFRTALAAKQVKLFPIFRKAFRENMRQSLWEHDVEVGGTGRSIQMVSVRFASNAYIKAAADGVGDEVQRLRFTTLDMRWREGGSGRRFNYAPIADSKIQPSQ
jgi:hypothetical protein